MARSAELTPITGDIAARAEVTVNTKGGSATATLKKALSDRLGALGGHLAGAAVEFATGQAVLLLAGAPGSTAEKAPLRVRQVGRNRFEIELAVNGDEEVDEVTAAFLRLKKDQFEKGMLDLSEPMSAADLRRKTDEEFADVEASLAEHSAKQKADAALIAAVKAALGGKVSDVRASRRATGGAAALVPVLQGRYRQLYSHRQRNRGGGKPVLELNMHHALIKVLEASLSGIGDTAVADFASFLLYQAKNEKASAKE